MTALSSAGGIAMAAGHCTRLFEDVLSGEPLDPQLEQQNDRFRLWAGNIGAHQIGKSSLDYRLREASDIADMTSQLLYGLQTQLEQWRLAEEKSVLSNRVRETIDDLYALLLIIREPPPLDRYTKHDDIDLSCFREFDARHVREKYPLLSSREELVARLTDANVRRRQFLKYRELHNQKLSRAPMPSPNNQDSTAETRGPPQAQHGQAVSKATTTSYSDAGASAEVPTLANTVAGPFLPKVDASMVDDFDEARSATTFASSAGSPSGTRLQIPPRPRASLDRQIFVCPLCYFPEQVDSDDGWKRHVLHDLQPYICLFDHCPSTLFASRHAWFEHELAAHRKEWACGICNARAKSASAFVEHARSIHQRTFPEKILPKILQQNERAQTRYKADDCPFCDDWVVNHSDRDIAEDDLYVTVKQFRQHVGRHMEELALFVLPLGLGEGFQSQKVAGEAELFDRPQDTSEIHKLDNPGEPAAQMTEEPVTACKQGHLEKVKKSPEAGGYVDTKFGDGSSVDATFSGSEGYVLGRPIGFSRFSTIHERIQMAEDTYKQAFLEKVKKSPETGGYADIEFGDDSSATFPGSEAQTIGDGSSVSATFLGSEAQTTGDGSSVDATFPGSEGQTIGDSYVLGRLIGWGSFSTIHEVTQMSPSGGQRKLAAKVVRRSVKYKSPEENEHFQAEFAHEVEIWRLLHHRHILPLETVWHTDEATYCFIPLNKGGTLFDLVRSNRSGVPTDLAKRYSYQLAVALRYLHCDARVAHRDVNLENCLLDTTSDPGEVRLCDFGMAERISNDRQPHKNINPAEASSFGKSLDYIAPETLRAPMSNAPEIAVISPAVDMWAYGVCVYTMVVGSRPFYHPFRPRISAAILSGNWDREKLLEKGGQDVFNLVLNCLETDPKKRWDADEVLECTWLKEVADANDDQDNSFASEEKL